MRRGERWTENKLIQKDICFECGSNNSIEYHHVVPYIKDGTKTIPLCIECHSKVHSIDFVKARELKKIGIQRARERGVVFGRKTGVIESIETFMAKERSQKIKYLLEAGYPYKKISDMVNCGISLVQKVSKIRKQQTIKSDNNDKMD